MVLGVVSITPKTPPFRLDKDAHRDTQDFLLVFLADGFGDAFVYRTAHCFRCFSVVFCSS